MNITVRYLLLPLLFLVFSCEDFLEEKPEDFIGPSQFENSSAGANQLVNGAYNAITADPMFRWGAFPKVLVLDSDYVTGPSWGMGNFGSGNFVSEWFTESSWNGPYTLIHRANLAISLISEMTFAEDEIQNYIGQLEFLKAWAYSHLATTYGELPIFEKSIEEGIDGQQPRRSMEEVYDHIISLLKSAETKLYSNTHEKYRKGRVSKGAASALLARVYLNIASSSFDQGTITIKGGPAKDENNMRIATPAALTLPLKQVANYESFNSMEYFQLARDKAKQVIDEGEYWLFDSYEDVWRVENRNSGEHIFSLQALSSDEILGNTISREFYCSFNDNGELSSGGWYGLRDHWYELFEDDVDHRVKYGVHHRWKQTNGYSYYYPAKHAQFVADENPDYGYESTDLYREGGNHIARLSKFKYVTDATVSRSDIHFPFLRYAETLLIFAEAENEINNGPTSSAYEALNAIRTRSNASLANENMNVDEFRSYVLEERARELALEGFRRNDLLRHGIYLEAMNAIDVDENQIVKRRSSRHLLLPMPIQEVNANKFIETNNPGW